LADRFEEMGIFDRLKLGGMALGDDGDFFGWELQVLDEVFFGVLGDGDYPGGTMDIVFGQSLKVGAFEGGTIAGYREGIDIVDGNYERQVAHGEGHIKMGIVIEIGVFREASKLDMLPQGQAEGTDGNDFDLVGGLLFGDLFLGVLDNFLLMGAVGIGKHLPMGIWVLSDEGGQEFLHIDASAAGQGGETQIDSDS